MPLGFWIFNETSPATAGTVPSSQPVSNSASYLSRGVAGPLDDYDAVDVCAELVGASGDVLDVLLQTSIDETNWFDAIHFPTLSAGASAIVYRTALTKMPQPASAAPVVVGKNLANALAANVTVQGPWGSRARLLFVAGPNTSAGAAVRVTLGAQRPRLRNL